MLLYTVYKQHLCNMYYGRHLHVAVVYSIQFHLSFRDHPGEQLPIAKHSYGITWYWLFNKVSFYVLYAL